MSLRPFLFLFASFLLVSHILYPTLAITKQESVEKFLETVRINDKGFANVPGGEVTISHTSMALQISNYLGFEVNNTLDILLFFQESQNEDGGFGSKPFTNSSWDETYHAIKGLALLDLNSSKLAEWNIYNYVNTTATAVLYEEKINGNETALVPRELTVGLIWKWIQFIEMTIGIGVVPALPFQSLTQWLTDMQFNNGSYIDLKTAIFSNILLSMLGRSPRDLELASKYIRAHQTSNGAFAWDENGSATLNATYYAILALDNMGQIGKLEYKESIVNFIINLQKPRSGFGEVGKEANVEDTLKAIEILRILDKISELIAPEVLLTEGFVSFQISPLFLAMGFLVMFKFHRKFPKNSK
ncbi:MAG: hypothetical protein D6732_01175 [Methanobacteriota archaeon]|nr:MAG: hypothetical protein D6732_01175 [Euryarchaeota archaeon]